VSNDRSVEGVVKAKIAAKSRDLSITTVLDNMALPKAPAFGALSLLATLCRGL